LCSRLFSWSKGGGGGGEGCAGVVTRWLSCLTSSFFGTLCSRFADQVSLVLQLFQRDAEDRRAGLRHDQNGCLALSTEEYGYYRDAVKHGSIIVSGYVISSSSTKSTYLRVNCLRSVLRWLITRIHTNSPFLIRRCQLRIISPSIPPVRKSTKQQIICYGVLCKSTTHG